MLPQNRQRYARLPKREKPPHLPGVAKGILPYLLFLAEAVTTAPVTFVQSIPTFEVMAPPSRLGDGDVGWETLNNSDDPLHQGMGIEAHIAHLLPSISTPWNTRQLVTQIALAGNDLKAALMRLDHNLVRDQIIEHYRVAPEAGLIQGDFRAGAIEGILSVEQAFALLLVIGLQNGMFDHNNSEEDLIRAILVSAVSEATGRHGFINRFASMTPFSGLVRTLKLARAPADTIHRVSPQGIPFVSLNGQAQLVADLRRNASQYWENHMPCPAVYSLGEEAEDLIQIPGTDLNSATVLYDGVSPMDLALFALCKQLAYRLEMPEFAEELQEIFDQRVALLREHNMLGLDLPSAAEG